MSLSINFKATGMRKMNHANLKRKQKSEIYQSEVDQRVDVAWKLRRRLIFCFCFFFFCFVFYLHHYTADTNFVYFSKMVFPAEDDKYRY